MQTLISKYVNSALAAKIYPFVLTRLIRFIR